MQKELKSHLKNHSIKFNHPIHSFMVYIKNPMHVLYAWDHSLSIVHGLIWQIFPQDQFNFHSWVTAKFSRDITGLHTLNCYIRKQILYFARLIDEQRKVSSANRIIYASVEAVTLAETIVMQINTMRNTVLTLMNGPLWMHVVVF